MTEIKLLIGDSDSAYGKALTAYMVKEMCGVRITTYSVPEAFIEDEGTYDLALLSDVFMRLLCERPEMGERFSHVLYLCDQKDATALGDYPAIFKFQQMSVFMQGVQQYIGAAYNGGQQSPQVKKRWLGIHSPVRHELQLPFALTYAWHRAKQKQVLFLDMETNSILEELLDVTESKSLLDVLYLHEENAHVDMQRMTGCYEGVSYIAPMRNFGEAAQITATQWQEIVEAVEESVFEEIVVLFDDGLQFVQEMLYLCEELILLQKGGDYYDKSMGKIRRYIGGMERMPKVRTIALGMSGSNLSDGTYRFEQLLRGNLGRFVAEMQ